MKLLFVDISIPSRINIVHLFANAGAHVDVFPNDDERLVPELLSEYDGLLIGPGPGKPDGAPKALQMLAAGATLRKPY